MKEGESIYKLVGPVLLKQEKPEAESTVNGRLEFINKEMYVAPFSLLSHLTTIIAADSIILHVQSERVDKQIKEVQEKIERKKGDIIQAQAGLQAAAGAGGAAGQVSAKA